MIPLLVRSAAQSRYVVLGALTLLCGFQIVIVGQAAEIERAQSFGPMADLLPGFLQRGLGSKALLLATFKGTIAFGYFHPIVCMIVPIMAMYVATEPAHEVEAGLVDLELARSVPRHRLLTRSLVLALVAAGAAAALMALGTYAGSRLFGAMDLDLPSASVRAWLLVHLFGVAACFASFALMVAAFSRRWAIAFTTATLSAVLLYLIDFLAIAWPAVRPMSLVSPFHYYPALSIISGDAPIALNLTVLYSSAAAFAAVAYWQFSRRDL
jgi:ABC-type transport system involved in multi-copper enzyme maturation permease subunit